MLELLCHDYIGIFMEALFDEGDAGIALSCHFALDLLCDKECACFGREGISLVVAPDIPDKIENVQA